MKFLVLSFLSVFVGTIGFAKTLKVPQGKGKCPKFTFEVEENWVLKSDRPKGDRWWLVDSITKENIVRIDYKLPNVDQKQLPIVEEGELDLKEISVSKFTTTSSLPEEGQKATEGLVTSYSVGSGKLKGLVFMSTEYSSKIALDKKIEKIISSIKLVK